MKAENDQKSRRGENKFRFNTSRATDSKLVKIALRYDTGKTRETSEEVRERIR